MTEKKIIQILLNQSHDWRTVNDQPCIHTFYENYYVNLCLWNLDVLPTISIDVDNIDTGLQDIIDLDVTSADEYFDELKALYVRGRSNAKNIAIESNAA